MELNGNGSHSKLEESRSKPFDIDLNETPLSSPRETVVTGAPADVTPEPHHSGQGIRGAGAAVGLLDINALPPVEEETCEFHNSGACDTSLIRNSNNGLATHSSLLHGGSQLDLLKASGSVASLVKSGYEDIVQQQLNFGGNLRETPSSIVKDSLWACDTSIQRAAFQKYYALDGNGFDSMFDVACHLGLVSKHHSVESQGRRDGFALMQKGLHLNPKRKDSLMFSQVKNLKESQENLKSSFGADYSLGIEAAESQACKLKSNLSVTQANTKENGAGDSLQAKVGLPVQFEDFCILAVGEVDPRPSYHSNSQIWPVGYRSSWHDKITGSLFVCDVSDGGDFGPLFKVKRYPCSTQPIPVGSTVLLRPSYDQQDGKGQVESDDPVGMLDDDYTNIQLIFSNDSPPHLEYDALSDSGKNNDEACNSQPMNNSETKSNCLSQSPGRPTTNYMELVDDIGEFLVEGRSSSSVWRMVSQTLAHACRKVYGQTGVCRFCCKHDVLRMWSSCFASLSEESAESLDSLAKFCCLSGPINIPHSIRSNDELDTSCRALIKWLDQDRFGLDADFVQEIIEQLPQVHVCAEYIFLNKRRDRLTSQTVGSGFLEVKRKSDIHDKEADGNLFRCSKRPREQISRNPGMKSCFPPGKPLSSKLPTELIGDVLQSWELLWRFSEVLGLEEPLSFKELEEELINGYSFTLGSSSTSNVPQQNDHAFIAKETEYLKQAAHVRQASNTNSGCTGVALANVLCSLLKILLGELQSKVATFVDSNLDGGESKSRRRRKKDADNLISAKKIMLDLLPINRLTWPELARRYALTVSSMEGNLDSVDFVNRESCKAFHCLQGDSGTIHGSLPGVAGMEAEALLLAEATKQIFGSLKNTTDISSLDFFDFDALSSRENIKVNDAGIPEWARVLEPVRKLPTNVGARIRKCVYDALDKGPPEWARKRLEHSISKEVYKGNASGPTKKAVLSVLSDVCGESQQQKPNRKRRNRRFSSASDVIMKQCQKVLRCAAAADEEKVFCNLLGRTLLNTSDNDDEGLLGFPAMVSRPLDFRTIDLRLAFGAYGGSHEAFLEDVREVWHHIRTAYSDQSDLLELAEKLSQNFEVLYEKEVCWFSPLPRNLMDRLNIECLNSEAKKEIEDILESASEMPKAPWDEGVCKVCGIDKDDDNVLLCDTCDSGYHTYCLSPPLARVPDGNWYCPCCATGNRNNQYTSQVPQVISRSQKRRYQGEFTRGFLESLSHLSTAMETRDYWEYSAKEVCPLSASSLFLIDLIAFVSGVLMWYHLSYVMCALHTIENMNLMHLYLKLVCGIPYNMGLCHNIVTVSSPFVDDPWKYLRIYLLKFLCDELLNSVIIREHLERSASVSADLQQKLRSLSLEWRNLKFKEEILAGKVARVNTSVNSATGKSGTEGVATLQTNYGTLMRQPPCTSSYFSSLPSDLVPEDGRQMYRANDFWKQPSWFYSKGTSVRKPNCSGNLTGKAPCYGLHVQQKLDNSLRIDNQQNELPIPAPQPQTHDSTVKEAGWSNFYRGQELQKGDNDSPVLSSSEVPHGNVSSDTIRNHVADPIHAMHMISENQFPDHHSIAQHDMNELQAHDLKVNLLRKEIAVLQEINCLSRITTTGSISAEGIVGERLCWTTLLGLLQAIYISLAAG
ncbi:hypothetical protein Patl1_16168 [Pistacia atlantica]|uniref:Uncharacterized protein n=1 Tax=Pistacia atlantica TaxID=434234 RepID=A0ACC1B927_9ROSI|nr:hypothetical protein Patl1_16168 [Pistacia atlantica]